MLKGEVANSIRELVRQGCQSRNITILQGSVGKDYIHILISYSPGIAPNKLVQYLKGRSSRLLQEEFLELQKKYWGQHLWVRGYFCATVGNVTEEMGRTYIANQGNEKQDEIFNIEK